jgi:hypothetical protein
MVEIQPTTADELLKQTGEVIMPVLRGAARKVSSAPGWFSARTTRQTDAGDILQYAGADRLRLISLASRAEKVLPARFPGITNTSFDISPDGKELVFVTPRLSSRLILLEKVFR